MEGDEEMKLTKEMLGDALSKASVSTQTTGHGESDPVITVTWGTLSEAKAIMEAARRLYEGWDELEAVKKLTILNWIENKCVLSSDDELWLTASTPFGNYNVEKRDGECFFRYCFDEYYDEDEISCESVEDAKDKAQAHWIKRLIGGE